MKQIKRPHVKVPVGPSELCKNNSYFLQGFFHVFNLILVAACCSCLTSLHLSSVGGVMVPSKIVAGDRSDNQWLQYNSSNLPHTQQSWDHCVFIEKTHWGYYSWPRFSFSLFQFITFTFNLMFSVFISPNICQTFYFSLLLIRPLEN